MLQSMTGFGQSEIHAEKTGIRILVKSINSKTADLNIKVPFRFKEKEGEIREMLLSGLQRGKIELFMQTESSSADTGHEINEDLLNAYLEKLKAAGSSLDVSDSTYFGIAAKMPNILVQDNKPLTEEEWNLIKESIAEAIEKAVQFRSGEGNVLSEDFILRVKHIRELLAGKTGPYRDIVLFNAAAALMFPHPL